MLALDGLVARAEQLHTVRAGYRSKAMAYLAELEELTSYLNDSLQAQQIISSVSDERTEKLIAYITGVLNKALSEIFPKSHKTVKLQRKLYRDIYPHINVVVEDEENGTVDLTLAMGAGIGVVVSFLYRICLIEVNGDRKLLITDEILHGIHKDAVVVLKEIIKLFASEGFQFLMVEYALDSVDLGKYYLVQRTGTYSQVVETSYLDVKYTSLLKELKGLGASQAVLDYASSAYEEGIVLTAKEAMRHQEVGKVAGKVEATTPTQGTADYPTNEEINFNLEQTDSPKYSGAFFTGE